MFFMSSRLCCTWIRLLMFPMFGRRPILFRATSLDAARSFSSDLVKHPHGNVISADGFARGVIRSATDYEVFEKGVEGNASSVFASP